MLKPDLSLSDVPLRPIYAVDDNPDDLFLLRRLLKKAGVPNPLRTFTLSELALAELLRLERTLNPVDARFPIAVVVDGNMPRLDGFALLGRLRQQRGFDDARLVMISASARDEDRERALQHGADQYLTKFPEPDIMARAIGVAELANG
jgi:CheY-like chemotaxis protein